ncbi:uncharacterized protein C8A04DRAFT_9063 [Dichotomopilus funicola]|uniref:FAD dependent oxidoreductase domain-containing protein n=1 Tax=Dichotomopilus funicola TaxID=1934379 RepID=A0AAN6VAC9_9PEZI|nr:hypothetical protein C8A04DRAFT_9063 [Dichotomopilus funicola]
MGKITILGAGIIGLATATVLSETDPSHTITIVARDLPGDAPSQAWASPWACAGWVALGGSPSEEAMQLAALDYLRNTLVADHPESETGVRSVTLTDVFGTIPASAGASRGVGVWFTGRVPGYEVLSSQGDDGPLKVRYGSAVINPDVFLGWIRKQLEARGVRFERVAEIKALGDLKGRGHDVLVNASGLASRTLEDVKDEAVIMDRTYVTVVKGHFDGAFVHRGEGVYTYMFGRGDGTVVVGGVSEPVSGSVKNAAEIHQDMFRRAHEYLPEHFPSPKPEHYEVVKDLVGIRPLRPAGVRAEREELDGQKVVHAYGTTIGGYIHSFGLAKEAARLVTESL